MRMKCMSRIPRLLLAIGLMWSAGLMYFILSGTDQPTEGVLRQQGLEAGGQKPWMKVVEEKEVQQQVHPAANSKAGENCQPPLMDGYPQCADKIKWMKNMWQSDPCYSRHGVNGSLCSILIYLSEVESWCPEIPGRLIPSDKKKTTKRDEQAVVRDNLQALLPELQGRKQYKWIGQRVRSMEAIWVEAGRSLSEKYSLTQRRAKQILIHPGVVTDEIHIAEAAFSGGPLGELVQWSDLIATLHILGHHLHLSASISDVTTLLGDKKTSCSSLSAMEPELIYTDILGLRQIQAAVMNGWIKHKCVTRILDSFGTESDFNHGGWAKKHNLASPYGALNMTQMQFYTMFPHTPDNTFLGFVVQPHFSAQENKQLNSIVRKKQALVYGKRASYWQGKKDYLDVVHKYFDIHGTVDVSAKLPSYVTNHGIVKGSQVHSLLRQSKVLVGLSFPYEGPAPLEALANGCVFLNPRLDPPLSRLNSDFFKDKPTIREVTSQHPYAETIGEPYVYTVDMKNPADVERALKVILKQTIEPYIPYEYTCEGMLQRVSVLVEKQDLCGSTWSWPPLSALQVVQAKADASCNQACRDAGLICEPSFFPHLNSSPSLARYGVECETWETSADHLVLPAHSGKRCLFQSDPLLFSCARSSSSWTRVCPCRDFIKDQIALCRDCL